MNTVNHARSPLFKATALALIPLMLKAQGLLSEEEYEQKLEALQQGGH